MGEAGPGVRQSLLEEGLPHFRSQLQFGNLRLIVLNGRQVLDHVTFRADMTGFTWLNPSCLLSVVKSASSGGDVYLRFRRYCRAASLAQPAE
jgi:hypothetical protein